MSKTKTVVTVAYVLCDTHINGVALKAGQLVLVDEATMKSHAHELDGSKEAVEWKKKDSPKIEPVDTLTPLDESTEPADPIGN